MEKKYFIIEVGEDISSSFLFDILDKLRQQGHYFIVSCTSNTCQFDFKRVTKEEFNKFNGYEVGLLTNLNTMMKPKEKAQEIFNKMYQVDDIMGNYPMCFDTAKKCALIAVDVILIDCGAKDWSGDEACDGKNYWQEVKSAMSDVQPYL